MNAKNKKLVLNIREIVESIDNLQSNIKDYSKEVQEQIIDYAFNRYCEIEFIEFVSFEFQGKELISILNKYDIHLK